MTVNFEDHMKLVYYIVHKYRIIPPAEYDDMVQEAFIGLWKAVKTFKPEKNYAFATYASRCIYNQINMYLRTIKKQKDIPTLDQPITHWDAGENTTNADFMLGSDSMNPVHSTIANDIVKRVFDYPAGVRQLAPHVEEREKEYFRYLLKGYRQVDIQKVIGTSQRNCSNHHTRIRERVRKYGRMANEEIIY